MVIVNGPNWGTRPQFGPPLQSIYATLIIHSSFGYKKGRHKGHRNRKNSATKTAHRERKQTKNKKKPYERNTENSDTSETISETDDQTDSEPTTEESKKISIVSGDVGNNDEEKNWKNTAGDNIFNSDGVKVECLSVDVVEDTDIVKQTKYSAEYFKTGELPDPDFIEKITDMEAVFEQAPDYEKL